MALDYDKLMSTTVVDLPFSYRDTETMLYALSVGLGRDPLHPRELGYVTEHGSVLKTMPSLATVLVPDMFPPDLGWDYSQVLHAEQRSARWSCSRQKHGWPATIRCCSRWATRSSRAATGASAGGTARDRRRIACRGASPT